MSFNNTESFTNDLERTATNKSSHYKDYPEYETTSQLIDKQLHHINSKLLPSLRSQISELNKNPDSTTQSGTITTTVDTITSQYKEINENIKSLNKIINTIESSHEDIEVLNYLKQKESIQIKLVRDSLNNFKNYQKRFEGLHGKISPSEALVQAQSQAQAQGENEGQVHNQDQVQVQLTYEPVNAEELEQQTLIIAERERELHRIHQDTQTINDIFQNLAGIVNEQQFQIDNIESNIFSYSEDVRTASHHLQRAERSQRSSTGRMCCCLVILGIVLGLIVVVTFI
ncbi:t-SNARE [Scheffersomyces amazonensis]|uniref:t-SNARE n=1 Tax=Scheffersomyces amazonensis TaxID=1078765 RepID=UPI00315DFEF7